MHVLVALELSLESHRVLCTLSDSRMQLGASHVRSIKLCRAGLQSVAVLGKGSVCSVSSCNRSLQSGTLRGKRRLGNIKDSAQLCELSRERLRRASRAVGQHSRSNADKASRLTEVSLSASRTRW